MSVNANIQLSILRAESLLGLNPGGTSNPYVTATIGTQSVTTEVMNKTTNPLFNSTFTFLNCRLPCIATLRVFNKLAFVDLEDPLGSATLTLMDGTAEPVEQVLTLSHGGNIALAQRAAKSGCGSLYVSYHIEPREGEHANNSDNTLATRTGGPDRSIHPSEAPFGSSTVPALITPSSTTAMEDKSPQPVMLPYPNAANPIGAATVPPAAGPFAFASASSFLSGTVASAPPVELRVATATVQPPAASMSGGLTPPSLTRPETNAVTTNSTAVEATKPTYPSWAQFEAPATAPPPSQAPPALTTDGMHTNSYSSYPVPPLPTPAPRISSSLSSLSSSPGGATAAAGMPRNSTDFSLPLPVATAATVLAPSFPENFFMPPPPLPPSLITTHPLSNSCPKSPDNRDVLVVEPPHPPPATLSSSFASHPALFSAPTNLTSDERVSSPPRTTPPTLHTSERIEFGNPVAPVPPTATPTAAVFAPQPPVLNPSHDLTLATRSTDREPQPVINPLQEIAATINGSNIEGNLALMGANDHQNTHTHNNNNPTAPTLISTYSNTSSLSSSNASPSVPLMVPSAPVTRPPHLYPDAESSFTTTRISQSNAPATSTATAIAPATGGGGGGGGGGVSFSSSRPAPTFSQAGTRKRLGRPPPQLRSAAVTRSSRAASAGAEQPQAIPIIAAPPVSHASRVGTGKSRSFSFTSATNTHSHHPDEETEYVDPFNYTIQHTNRSPAAAAVYADPMYLFSAASTGSDLAIFRTLRVSDPDLTHGFLNCIDESGRTLLHVAAWYGQLAVLHVLLVPIPVEVSPSLVIAARRASSSGNSLLHSAAAAGRVEVWRWLEKVHPYIASLLRTSTNGRGQTPAGCAEEAGFVEFARLLAMG